MLFYLQTPENKDFIRKQGVSIDTTIHLKEEIPMANRIRNERLEIKLTEEEKALFEEKRKLAKCRNMSHFIRKCVLEKDIYHVDLEPFRDLQGLLSNATIT